MDKTKIRPLEHNVLSAKPLLCQLFFMEVKSWAAYRVAEHKIFTHMVRQLLTDSEHKTVEFPASTGSNGKNQHDEYI